MALYATAESFTDVVKESTKQQWKDSLPQFPFRAEVKKGIIIERYFILDQNDEAWPMEWFNYKKSR